MRRLPGVYFCDAPRQVLALLPDGRGNRITDAAEKPARLEWEVFLFTEPGEPETLSLFKHETRDLIEFATFTILDSKSSPGAYDIEYSVDKGGSSMLRRCAASAPGGAGGVDRCADRHGGRAFDQGPAGGRAVGDGVVSRRRA